MKKLILLAISVFLLFSCAEETPQQRNSIGELREFTVAEHYWGTWEGRDYGKTLYIEEHFIMMELPDRTLNITQAVQMAQNESSNNLGLENELYLNFERHSLDVMLVTLNGDFEVNTVFQDTYGRVNEN